MQTAPSPQLDIPPAPSRQTGIQAEPPPRQVKAAATQHPRRAKPLFVGRASFYAYHGGKTASGAPFNPHGLTAAHRTLPFGTRVRVTDLKTHKSVNVTITDRGPHSPGRIIDLSLGAAKVLGVGDRGVIQVRAEVLGNS
jgi:rare lipoprotein A